MLTSITTKAADTSFTVLTQHTGIPLGNYFVSIADDGSVSGNWYKGYMTETGSTSNSTITVQSIYSVGGQSFCSFSVDTPVFIPLVFNNDNVTVDLNRYYSIAPWVGITINSGGNYSNNSQTSPFVPHNIYLYDEYGKVFFLPQGNGSSSSSPNGDSFFGKGSGVFYKGVDLVLPFSSPADSNASRTTYGKYLYLHFEGTCLNTQTTAGSQAGLANPYAGINYSITANSWFLGISDDMNNALQNQTTDKATQDLINQQNQLQQQANTLQTNGNRLQNENNHTALNNYNTNKDTNNKITSFFGSFFDNLIGVFVPESGFFSQWFNDLNTFMSQKLGFLWSPFDFIISFLNGIYNSSSNGPAPRLVFPELAWIDGTIIIPRTEFSFDSFPSQGFGDLRDMIYFATDVILLGAVVHQFYQKIKLVFEGGAD